MPRAWSTGSLNRAERSYLNASSPPAPCATCGVAVVAAMMPRDLKGGSSHETLRHSLLILSSASQRTDHAAVLPANLKGGAAKKVIDKLLNEKLLQELRAKDEMPVWRRGEDNRPYSLRITKAGLRAIEVEDATAASDDSPGGPSR